MRRAPSILAVIAVAVSACLGGTACGPDLPDRMWRSDNVRYFSRPGDDSVCPAILDEIEQHGQLIADALMLPSRTLVSYYKFDGLDDYDHNAECGSGAAACSINATARSPVDFDRHELIHAYLSPYGRPPWLLEEGTAVALSCQRYPRPTISWRDAYALDHKDPALYGAGGWLVGYLLTMFPARYLPRFYNRVAINATADQFAEAFLDAYCFEKDRTACITLDQVWAAAIGGDRQPTRCPWECSRPAFPIDGEAHALTPVCSGGTLQQSVDIAAAGLSRWRIEGAGRFTLQSCTGQDAPLVSVSGMTGPGELLAPVEGGSYFIHSVIETGGTPSLSATIDTGAGLSWSDCATAPILPDDLSALSTLALFYPSSTTPQFTSFASGMKPGMLLLTPGEGIASASLCASCDQQTCVRSDDSWQGIVTYATAPGAVLTVPGGPAVTAAFYW
jgi:hypothetical protein